MSSTCPEVPSFSGIRVPSSAAPKRAIPLRRPMPKARQASTSASTPILTKSATTLKEESSKPKLSLSPAVEPPHRDSGPEEGEISDDEDDHYSPAEATTPVHVPFVNPFELATLGKPVPPKPSFLNVDSKSNGDSLRKEPSSLSMSATQDLESMSMPELRKSAQAAVMYLACSAKMSFDDIVGEGIDRSIVASYFSQLKLPMPTSEPRDSSSKEQLKTVDVKKTAPDVIEDSKLPIQKPVQSTPMNHAPAVISSLGQPPSSLPPRPPPTLPPQPSLIPKTESVVSRFNQSLPGLNILQQANSPIPASPPVQVETNAQDVVPASSHTISVTLAGVRNRKRPVAADFDTEAKPTLLISKQARFGNRELLETSRLVFDVSDNEDGDTDNGFPKQVSRLASQISGVPSRPDSTTPEDSEKINESIRLKEAEIELMRQKIKLMTRKRKLAGGGDSGSGPPTKPSTPLPNEPLVELDGDNQTKYEQVQKLEQVEQFLHQTLDQIEASAVQAGDAAAISVLATEPLQIVTGNSSSETEAIINNTMAGTLQNGGQEGDFTENIDVNDTSFPTSAISQLAEIEKAPSSEESYETAPIESEAVPSEDADDGQGEPMDLSDLSSSSGDLNLESDRSASDSNLKGNNASHYSMPCVSPTFTNGTTGSNSNSSEDDTSSEDSAEDIEMLDEPGTDSVSSPMQEEPDPDDNYDPESREADIGEVSLPSGNAKLSQVQPPSVIEMAKPNTTARAKQGQKTEEFKPYRSALAGFKSFRYHPNFNGYVSQGFKSLTYSNHIDSELPIFCCDTAEVAQLVPIVLRVNNGNHTMLLHPVDLESQILSELAEPDANLPDKDKESYKSALAQTISEQGELLVGDFEKIANNIVEYRRQQLGDPTRVLRNI
ncbi:hypothetical protein Dda_4906 [Drechslerella dactyloides]|uniref:Uncharacterized protein n=1 Tax=Drechslerella dactyloides TaxID=74499 RepID=A0AAD6NJG8_DREDA|nr:hypothetical protein Dda_4906 [Drechslerella dactyloides]